MKAFIIHPSFPKLFSQSGHQPEQAEIPALHSCGHPHTQSWIPTCMPEQKTIKRTHQLQMLFFSAEMQKAFTIFLAGAAFTLMVLPKASLVPAFLARLTLVLIMQRPGMVNLPDFFTSAVARLAKLSRRSKHSFLFRPLLR